MKHSFVDRFAELESPLHLLDARTKLIGFIALAAAVLYIPPGNSVAFLPHFSSWRSLPGSRRSLSRTSWGAHW